MVAYTLFSDPWMILLVEPLHGVTYALLQLSSVLYAAKLAPKGLETTTQGLKDTVRFRERGSGVRFQGLASKCLGFWF